jgi:hypothetical protein
MCVAIKLDPQELSNTAVMADGPIIACEYGIREQGRAIDVGAVAEAEQHRRAREVGVGLITCVGLVV